LFVALIVYERGMEYLLMMDNVKTTKCISTNEIFVVSFIKKKVRKKKKEIEN
jgi:hypothetical protein